jgi:hypothetical protein
MALRLACEDLGWLTISKGSDCESTQNYLSAETFGFTSSMVLFCNVGGINDVVNG